MTDEVDPITTQANVLLARIAAAKAEPGAPKAPTPTPPSAEDLIGAGMDHSSPLYCAASAIVAALDRLAERRCDGRATTHRASDALLHEHVCTRLHGHAGGCAWRPVDKP